MESLITIGWRERLSLPDLNIKSIRTKIDTGAKTSSLHAINIQVFEKNGKKWLRFDTQLKRSNRAKHKQASLITCEAPLIEMRDVTNSGGQTDLRPVILTKLKMGNLQWQIQLTLADRSNMKFSLLLGRRAMGDKFLVNPSLSFMLSKPTQ